MNNRQMPIHTKTEGFSMLELLVSVTVLLIVCGATISVLTYAQRMYLSQESQSDMHAGLRGTFELLTQEISQAGSLNFTPQTLTANVTGSSTAQNVPVSSTANLYVGEKITVDTGSSQEVVAITAIGTNQVSGVFTQNHTTGDPFIAQGVFPQGVLSTSTATSLQLFGDINADGSLTYVRYDCDTTGGTVTRSITTIAPGVTTRNTAQTLLTNLVANPGGTPCFQYGSSVTASGYTFVPSVAVSLTVQTSERDPQTGAFVTMTKSFSNLASRNVLAGLTMAQSTPAITNRLQVTPPNVPYGP